MGSQRPGSSDPPQLQGESFLQALVNLFPVSPSPSYLIHYWQPVNFEKKSSLYSFCLKISIASGAYKINLTVVHETV